MCGSRSISCDIYSGPIVSFIVPLPVEFGGFFGSAVAHAAVVCCLARAAVKSMDG